MLVVSSSDHDFTLFFLLTNLQSSSFTGLKAYFQLKHILFWEIGWVSHGTITGQPDGGKTQDCLTFVHFCPSVGCDRDVARTVISYFSRSGGLGYYSYLKQWSKQFLLCWSIIWVGRWCVYPEHVLLDMLWLQCSAIRSMNHRQWQKVSQETT